MKAMRFASAWLLLLPLHMGLASEWAAAQSVGAHGLPEPDAVVPRLFATGFESADGLVGDGQGNLYVANYRRRGTVGRIARDGTASIWCDVTRLAPMEGGSPRPAGMAFDRLGRLLIADAGTGRLLRVAEDASRIEVLADRCNNQRFTMLRDVAVTRSGHVYFTDTGEAAADQPMGSLYRYDITTRKVYLVDTELAAPTGLAVAPDQSSLYVAESRKRRILRYTLHEDPTAPAERTIFCERSELSPMEAGDVGGIPDGMRFDAQGRLFVAIRGAGVVAVVAQPEGRVLRRYPAGGADVRHCWVGADEVFCAIADKEAVFRLSWTTRP